jgi:F-type H+-transporting ATPase subunit b
MDKLLQPDTGLMIWTIVTFVAVLIVLSKAAWKPILDGINSREQRIREDIERAEKANAEASRLREQYESQLSQAQKTIQDLVTQARADGERARAELIAQAKAEADRIVEKGRRDLNGETDKLRAQLREEVAGLSISVAEKILKRSIDKKVADDVMSDSVRQVSEVKR